MMLKPWRSKTNQLHLRGFGSSLKRSFPFRRPKLTGGKRNIKKHVKTGLNAASYDLHRLPRPCRRKVIIGLLPDKFQVFEPLANDADNPFQKPARVCVLALVEPERLLVEYTGTSEKVQRSHRFPGYRA